MISFQSDSQSTEEPSSRKSKLSIKMNFRTAKITAIAQIVRRFSSAVPPARIACLAIANSSTSMTLPGVCLISILMNSIPMTRVSVFSRNSWNSAVPLL